MQCNAIYCMHLTLKFPFLQRSPAGLLWELTRWRLWTVTLPQGDQAADLQKSSTAESEKQKVGILLNFCTAKSERSIWKVCHAAEDAGCFRPSLLWGCNEGEESPAVSAAGDLKYFWHLHSLDPLLVEILSVWDLVHHRFNISLNLGP